MKRAQMLREIGPSLLAVALPGLVGLAVLFRTSLVYVGKDALALSIMALMTVGFGFGLIELVFRLRAAVAIAIETRALPVPATEEAIERASPGLGAFLRARVEHAPTPRAAESFTPYLVGLMVMLGLLGTLLGLFETLHGAGQALTASGSIDALREGLSAPMRGLTRSFGCSAAGVTASAMLGLSAVFVRRVEARAMTSVQAYANGPLRALSPLRRQFDALDRLATQGEALPDAARALDHAARLLEGLGSRWEEAHSASAEAQRKVVTEAVDRLRGELTQAAAAAAKDMHDRVAPLLEQSVARTGEAAARHMSAVLEALERDVEVRRRADEGLRTAVRDELGALRAWAEADADTRAHEAHKRLDLVEEAMRRHAREQTELLASHRDQAVAHVTAIAEAARALTTQLTEESATRRAESSALLGDLGGRMDDASRAQAEASREQLEAIAALARQLMHEAQERETALSARWEKLASEVERASQAALEREAEHARTLSEGLAERNRELVQAETERSQNLLNSVVAQSQELTEGFAELAQRVERTASATRDEDAQRALLLEAMATKLETALSGAAQRIETELDQRARLDAEQAERAKRALDSFTENAELLQRVLASLEQGQVSHAKALADELSAHASQLGQGLSATGELIRDAATLLKTNSIEMAAVAEMFASSVERHREAAQGWLESLGEVEGAVERAGRGAAADALGDQLASTQEVFARQLQFQRELFEQLRTLRALTGQSHAEQADVSA